MSNVSKLSITGIVLICLGFLCTVIALGTEYWIELNATDVVGGTLGHWGFWRVCGNFERSDDNMEIYCVNNEEYKHSKDYWVLMVVFQVIGVLCMLMCIIIWAKWMTSGGISSQVSERASTRIRIGVVSLLMLAVSLHGTVVYLWTKKRVPQQFQSPHVLDKGLGWSWILGIVSCVLEVVACLPVCLAKNMLLSDFRTQDPVMSASQLSPVSGRNHPGLYGDWRKQDNKSAHHLQGLQLSKTSKAHLNEHYSGQTKLNMFSSY